MSAYKPYSSSVPPPPKGEPYEHAETRLALLELLAKARQRLAIYTELGIDLDVETPIGKRGAK